MNNSPLDREWSLPALLSFALPTMAMMLFMGCYTVVDTIFVARFVDADALAAINIVCPVVNVTVGLGTMLATGGNAIVSRKLGVGEKLEAKADFTLLVIAAAVVGVLLLGGGSLWKEEILLALGASPQFPIVRNTFLSSCGSCRPICCRLFSPICW